ncbi:hypothetical protein JVU11DRAFT_8089 [Chiua virens]|nr:hypothetical protein JVU11DRAFT_8089 [Chiua virens]
MSAIRKFNKYCEELECLYDPACAIPLPTPLSTKLADLCSNQTLLEDVWITPSHSQIPWWLEDAKVHTGIRVLLKRDRCCEEQRQLGIEADSMCRWFRNELTALELALQLPEYLPYHFLLQHRCDAMLELQVQWPTPLASAARYASCVQDTLRVANQLSGSGTPSSAQLHWIPPIIYDLPLAAHIEDVEDNHPQQPIDDDDHEGPEEVLLSNVLDGSDKEDKEDKEDCPVATPSVKFEWTVPENLIVDFINIMTEMLTTDSPIAEWTRPPQACEGFRQLVFKADDIEILTSPEMRLNDTCLNGCTALLYSEYVPSSTSTITIFSTHDLLRMHYNALDKDLWQATHRTKYWEKKVWILPIHRPSSWGHWVVCSIYFNSRHLLLFDSIAEQVPWQNDLLV